VTLKEKRGVATRKRKKNALWMGIKSSTANHGLSKRKGAYKKRYSRRGVAGVPAVKSASKNCQDQFLKLIVKQLKSEERTLGSRDTNPSGDKQATAHSRGLKEGRLIQSQGGKRGSMRERSQQTPIRVKREEEKRTRQHGGKECG